MLRIRTLPLPERRKRAEKARAAEASAQQQVEGLEAALREVRGRVEQRRADATSQASQGAVVKALMEARRRGDIEGIHGRLGGWQGLGPGWFGAGGASQHWAAWKAPLHARQPMPSPCLPAPAPPYPAPFYPHPRP